MANVRSGYATLGLLVPRESTDRDPTPSLERTALPGVFRLHGADRARGLDVANLKGQSAADHFITQQDADAHKIPRAEWERFVADAEHENPRVALAHFKRLVATYAGPQTVKLESGGAKLEVEPTRAQFLRGMVDVLRRTVNEQQAIGKEIVYPRQNEQGVYVASPSRGPNDYLVDPAKYARCKLSAAEAFYVFDMVATRTERVSSNGRLYYMNPATKEVMDTRMRELFTRVMAERGAGKRVVYLSTFISSVDPKTNCEIAAFVASKVMEDPGYGGKVWVLNPAEQQVIKGANGDDYMYMWESLLALNVFDAARFTSAADTYEFFRAKGESVPFDYIYHYGDVLHSAGCRREMAIFGLLNADSARTGHAHLQVPIYYGTEPISPQLLDSVVQGVQYDVRGEIV